MSESQGWKIPLFAVGHMAVAYLLGKGSSKILSTTVNVPLLIVLSILPDIDIIYDFLMGTEIHRGPTHSILFAVLLFLPIFIIYRKKAIPYFLVLLSHSLICDFLIGGHLLLLWPFSAVEYGLPYIDILSPVNIVLEFTLFLIAMAVLVKTDDWRVFLSHNKTNLILIIPVVTVLLPSTVGYPFDESLFITQPVLAIAHIIYLCLFTVAILKSLLYYYRQVSKSYSQSLTKN